MKKLPVIVLLLMSFITIGYCVAGGGGDSSSGGSPHAIWTGRQEQVQTVSGQMARNCEYTYADQKFWRIFKNSCPGSIELQ
jgi:hypothetical protein